MPDCIILQGLPGSGKSSLASIFTSLSDFITLSADDFFIDIDGVYRFDKSKLHEAHTACYESFKGLCHEGRYSVVIDNTNTTRSEYERYKNYAEKCDYRVFIIEIKTDLSDESLRLRNIHNVPVETIKKMRERMK